MTTMKRISIQLAGGKAELSSGGRAQSAKKPKSCLLTEENPHLSKSDPRLGSAKMAVPDSARATRICYYKYRGPESISKKKLYLSTANFGFDSSKSPGRVPSARPTMRPPRKPSKWASASAEHNLVAMNYHLAELSLHYRTPCESSESRPTLLFREEAQEPEPLCEEEEMASPPPPPSSSVPSPREPVAPLMGSGTTSSCQIPDPEELVQKSTSNRLLNVISIDECHLKHRRARRRVKSSKREPPLESPDNERFLIHEDIADCPSLDAGSMASLLRARSTVLDRIERLNGFRSAPLLSGEGTKAQQLFSRRNQLLREHMNVYVAWRTSERLKERVDKMRGVRSALGVLEASKEDRLKAFSAVLRRKELEFAQLDAAETPSEGSEEALETDDLKEALISEVGDPEGNKLTRMWEVLQ